MLLAAVAACDGAAPPDASGSPGRPNLLMIVMDTTRGDRCGFNGYELPTTPRLDEFARDAVVFRDAWSPAGWTLPAHASLFTGDHPSRHGVLEGGRLYLEDSARTLGEILLESGWRTACFTNNDFVSHAFGLAQGFETFEPHFSNPARTYPWAPYTHERALGWIRARGDGRPFFAFVNDMEPHLPYHPPEDRLRPLLPADATPAEVASARAFGFPETMHVNLGRRELGARRWELVSRHYDAEIATLDAAIGDLLDALRSDGVLDDTIVVVVGDHGENLGEHGLCEHKGSLSRAIRHVPLLVRYPRADFRGGRVVDSAVRLEDVLPTVLELAGLPPADVDGVPLTRDLEGRIAPAWLGPQLQDVIDLLRTTLPELDPAPFQLRKRAVYDGRYHYVVSSDGTERLYDVRADPGEHVDLAPGGGPELVRMRALVPPW